MSTRTALTVTVTVSLLLAEFEGGVDLQRAVGIHLNAGPLLRLEPVDLHAYVIPADRQLRERIQALAVSRRVNIVPSTVFVAVTLTPGMTPPLGSLTVPDRLPLTCAEARLALARMTVTNSSVRRRGGMWAPMYRGDWRRDLDELMTFLSGDVRVSRTALTITRTLAN